MEKSDFEKLLDFCNENAFDRAEVEKTQTSPTEFGHVSHTTKSERFRELLSAARLDLETFNEMRIDFEIVRHFNRSLDKDSPVTSIIAMMIRIAAEVSKPQIFVAECKFSNGEIEPAFVVASLRGLAQTSMREIFE
jgi:hypothetical protein